MFSNVETERQLTNNQKAEEYGQPTGLLFFLGLHPCLHGKNGLEGWGCWGRWLDSRRCRVEGLITVIISVIGLAARRQSGEKACWCEPQHQSVNEIALDSIYIANYRIQIVQIKKSKYF